MWDVLLVRIALDETADHLLLRLVPHVKALLDIPALVAPIRVIHLLDAVRW